MYFGKQPDFQQYLTDSFTSNATTYAAGYPLTYNPSISQALLVSIQGLTQRPLVDYVVSAQVLTFTPAIPDGLTIHVRYLGVAGTVAGVADGSITGAKVAPNWLSAITSKVAPADADELPITDSAAGFGLKKLTWANLKNSLLGLFSATSGAALIGNTPAGNVTGTTVQQALASLDARIDAVALSTLTSAGSNTTTITNNLAPKASPVFSGLVVSGDLTDSTSTTTGSIQSRGGLGVALSVYAGGNVTAYSDSRIKTDIKRIESALSKVGQLHGYTYDRTDITIPRQTGVIAQEVLAVLPEAVLGSEDTLYSVAYGNMIGLLIEAINELKAEVDVLKGK